ncbi:MAG TPA: HD domain-containing phosphohydrolase [Candidatus Limnocylindria bacterium]|nr:HD domain-containing phosphohydrolase [Candidatus Limnocylindria bacterium]
MKNVPKEPSSGRDRAGGSLEPAASNGLEAVRVSEVLSALSFALDLTEGQPFGHALRTCLIGMRLGSLLDLPLQERRDLYYALLLKDVGCSSNAARLHELFGGDDRTAKHDLKRVDWADSYKAMRYAMAHAAPGASWFERARRMMALANLGPRAAEQLTETRCERGATIVTQLGFSAGVSGAVASLDEHWDGRGLPRGLRGPEIPILSRIMGLAQTVEVFAALDGVRVSLDLARRRSGTWFDPALVAACQSLEREITEWCALDDWGLQDAVQVIEPGDAALLAGPGTLDRISRGFASVVDAKSPFTAHHSDRVAEMAMAVAEVMGYGPDDLAELRRAALLHDLGKLSVSNAILDKPAPLSGQEWEIMRLHPYYTQRILDRISGFQTLAFIASSHHERLDGRGYFRGLRGAQVPPGARILAVADVYEALTSDRPYRPALPEETALRIMEKDRGIGFGGDCLEALVRVIEDGHDQADSQAA